MTGDTGSADWTESGTPVVSIVNAVAAVTGRDASTLSPLEHTLDTDALNELMNSSAPAHNSADPHAETNSVIQLSFTYEGCWVVIENTGQLEVQPSETHA